MFCHGDMNSVMVLKEAIEEFGSTLLNYNKSTIIFGCMSDEDKQSILHSIPIKVENLPIKYLGVPLTSKRIGVRNYKVLIDKFKNRVLNRKNKCLSYAGRLQLIASVLNIGVLQSFITHRDLYNVRWKDDIVVKDIVVNGVCQWPVQWTGKYPQLTLQSSIMLDNQCDALVWRSKKEEFWRIAMTKMGVQLDQMDWNMIVNHIASLYGGNSIDSVIKRLGLATCVYLICQERNFKIFKDEKRSSKELVEVCGVLNNSLDRLCGV
ncbi:hypothetical protein Tco_1366588 [Tanacetum coccineum]